MTGVQTCALPIYNCENALWGCADCKKELAFIINRQFREIREKRLELEKNQDFIRKIIAAGSEQAREKSSKFLRKIKDAMKLYV